MQPEDFWFAAPRKGIMVFALPGEPGLTELSGDFKIQFHDRQGDFYWYVDFDLLQKLCLVYMLFMVILLFLFVISVVG